MTETPANLGALLDPVVTAMGYELLCVEYDAHARMGTLRVFIDAPQGVGVDDCERVSREVAAVLDVEDPIRHAYRLEISSPGLDRPLVKPEHYRRFVGEQVQVSLAAPREGRRRWRGTLMGLDGDLVSLQTGQGAVQLRLSEIEKARLVPNLDIARAGG